MTFSKENRNSNLFFKETKTSHKISKKEELLLQDIKDNIPDHACLVGRIKSWIASKEGRLPMSCTVMSVDDSMEGKNGIESSWIFTSYGLRHAAGVAIDLSKLRGKDVNNGKGLVSSGASSFAQIYSEIAEVLDKTDLHKLKQLQNFVNNLEGGLAPFFAQMDSKINEILRRGGTFKNGAVTLYLDYDHPDFWDFLNLTAAQLPWAKRAIYIDKNIINPEFKDRLQFLAKKVDEGTVWLAKKQWDSDGNRLYSQVCMEVMLKSRGTCLLHHINLGSFSLLSDIPKAFAENMTWLCRLHSFSGVNETGQYLSSIEDRQVGLGVIGLANLLAIYSCTYSQFCTDLEAVLNGDNVSEDSVAYWINLGIQEAAKVARTYNMDRAFTIAPTVNCSRNYVDIHGYTCAAEISAPLAHEVDRDSEVFGVETYEYHPKSEIAKEVGWDTQWKLLNLWQRMMDSTGLAHAISSNIWTNQKITPEWITDEFLPAAIKTTYYRLIVDQTALDKTRVVTANDTFTEKLTNNSVHDYSDSYDHNLDHLDIIYSDDPMFESEKTNCSVSRRVNRVDDDYCEACGG